MTSAPPEPAAAVPPAELTKAVEAARAAKRLQDTADALKAQAAAVGDPAERERLWQAAYDKEVEARGESRKARLMASGWGQGAAAGLGVASAVGMGLGNLVGVLASGVVAIPGTLVGAGVGALHGPWYKLAGGRKKDGAPAETQEQVSDAEGGSDEEAHRAVVAAVRRVEEEEAKEKSKGSESGDRLEGK